MASAESDPEEGEIVDDDLEDISDTSILIPISGKFLHSKEHLPALSLSSVSDIEEVHVKCKKRRRKRKGKWHKKKKFCRRHLISDSDSDAYMPLDKRLLKAAIQTDNHKCHKNSLQSRLKAMTRIDDNNANQNDENAKSEEQKVSSDEIDNELIQLRLEALRTAVLNKFQHRKKAKIRHAVESDSSDFLAKIDDKENHVAKKPLEEDFHEKEKDIHVLDNHTPPEDDEDVLRALLLASMSKRITGGLPKASTENNIKQKLQPKVVNNGSNATVQKTVLVKNMLNKNNLLLKNNNRNKPLQMQRKITQVKPIIINVNDSDTDEDSLNKSREEPKSEPQRVKDKAIEITVEKFLKEQRAKVEAERAEKDTSEIFQKSSVKLLSKDKQIEYQKLLQKLKNAQKPRVKRASYRVNMGNTVKSVSINSKKVVRNKLVTNKTNSNKTIQVTDIKSEVLALRRTLKEMQVQKNGRLQIQAKYVVLTPIVKKINEVSIERKRYDKEVTRLLDELAGARKQLEETHLKFTTQVKDLISKKKEIDKSSSLRSDKTVIESKPQETLKSQQNEQQIIETRFTSTPIKEKAPSTSFSISTIPDVTPNKTLPDVETKKNEDDIICIDDDAINPGDPNDIDQIYKKAKDNQKRGFSELYIAVG